MPVSYTHLDVYKRQVSLIFLTGLTIERTKKSPDTVTKAIITRAIKHIDVYKRQVLKLTRFFTF